MDKFQVLPLSCTQAPQRLVWLAMHQCYSEESVIKCVWSADEYSEKWYGDNVVKHLLAGNRGHYSPLEHASVAFAVAGYPHSVMQQYRTHRTGISFSVQSTRYTGERIVKVAQGLLELSDVFYTRAPGEYMSRSGKYSYSENEYRLDLDDFMRRCIRYAEAVYNGVSHEHARYLIFGYALRQDFVMTVNARTLMHLLDLRHKPDAELEAQHLAKELYKFFESWMPEVAAWYNKSRLSKGMLAP